MSADKYQVSHKHESMTQMEVTINWKDIEMIEKTVMAPFIIASYDIEADSSHGDFPLPQKTYKKLVTEILQTYHKYKLDTQKDLDTVVNTLYNYLHQLLVL